MHAKIHIGFMINIRNGDKAMSILDKPENRVKLLRAGFTGKEIEELAVKVLDSNVEVIKVNWCD